MILKKLSLNLVSIESQFSINLSHYTFMFYFDKPFPLKKYNLRREEN